MAKPLMTIPELKALVAAEARKHEACADVSPDSLVILADRSRWIATPRQDGGRIDEERCARLYEISRKLAAGFAVSEEAGPASPHVGAAVESAAG